MRIDDRKPQVSLYSRDAPNVFQSLEEVGFLLGLIVFALPITGIVQ